MRNVLSGLTLMAVAFSAVSSLQVSDHGITFGTPALARQSWLQRAGSWIRKKADRVGRAMKHVATRALRVYNRVNKFANKFGRAIVDDIKEGVVDIGKGAKKWAKGVGQTFRAMRHLVRGEKKKAFMSGLAGWRNMQEGRNQAGKGLVRVGSYVVGGVGGAVVRAGIVAVRAGIKAYRAMRVVSRVARGFNRVSSANRAAKTMIRAVGKAAYRSQKIRSTVGRLSSRYRRATDKLGRGLTGTANKALNAAGRFGRRLPKGMQGRYNRMLDKARGAAARNLSGSALRNRANRYVKRQATKLVAEGIREAGRHVSQKIHEKTGVDVSGVGAAYRAASRYGRGKSASRYGRGKSATAYGRGKPASTYGRGRSASASGRGRSASTYKRAKPASTYGRSRSRSSAAGRKSYGKSTSRSRRGPKRY